MLRPQYIAFTLTSCYGDIRLSELGPNAPCGDGDDIADLLEELQVLHTPLIRAKSHHFDNGKRRIHHHFRGWPKLGIRETMGIWLHCMLYGAEKMTAAGTAGTDFFARLAGTLPLS